MRVIWLNVEDEQPPVVVDIEGKLEEFYKLCDCDYVDITRMHIGKSKKAYSVVLDDEGLLKDSPKLSAHNCLTGRSLFGNLVICGDMDDEQDVTSLTDEDIQFIKGHIFKTFTKYVPGYYVLNFMY